LAPAQDAACDPTGESWSRQIRASCSRRPFREQTVVIEAEGKVLHCEFLWRANRGSLHVGCMPNSDPGFWGCWSSVAEGFPVCTATIEYPRHGYRSMFGWVQVVRSTDNESGGERFELDPFALFGDAPTPYCWYGQRPVLFDAPSRSGRQPLDWIAHSFLATTPLDEVAQLGPRRVVPVVGFSWGFTDDGSNVTLHDLAVLSPGEWSAHLDLLRGTYPRWLFANTSEN
jgi:hypothetical protein